MPPNENFSYKNRYQIKPKGTEARVVLVYISRVPTRQDTIPESDKAHSLEAEDKNGAPKGGNEVILTELWAVDP